MGAPAGWYADPQDQQLIRYFDGERWTQRTAPRPGAGPQPGQPGAPTGYTHGGTAPTGYGTQPYGAQQGSPARPQSPTAGFQFSGAQQVPTADAAPSPGTPRSVKIGILAAFLACAALFAVGYLMTDRDTDQGTALTASDLGIEGIECSDLVDQYVVLSVDDAADMRLVSASDGVEDVNELGSVRAPSGSGQNLVIGCSYPTAEWADGSQTPLVLDVSVDKDLGLFIMATPGER